MRTLLIVYWFDFELEWSNRELKRVGGSQIAPSQGSMSRSELVTAHNNKLFIYFRLSTTSRQSWWTS